jgi:hypothetical protein
MNMKREITGCHYLTLKITSNNFETDLSILHVNGSVQVDFILTWWWGLSL